MIPIWHNEDGSFGEAEPGWVRAPWRMASSRACLGWGIKGGKLNEMKGCVLEAFQTGKSIVGAAAQMQGTEEMRRTVWTPGERRRSASGYGCAHLCRAMDVHTCAELWMCTPVQSYGCAHLWRAMDVHTCAELKADRHRFITHGDGANNSLGNIQS